MLRRLITGLLILATAWCVVAQDATEQPRLMLTGDCQLIDGPVDSQLFIPFYTLGSDGTPLAPERITVTDQVAQAEIDLLNPVAVRDPRQPLQILFIMDVTGSVQLDALSDIWINVLTNYNSEDRFALMSFSDANSLGGVDPLILGDRIALVGDIGNLERNNDPAQGIAALYQALELGVERSANEIERSGLEHPVVLVITDSSNTATSGFSANDVIEAAQEADVRLFAIGYRTADSPDDQLPRIAAETNGYAWMPDGGDTADNTAARVAERMVAFREALEAEFLLTVGVNEVQLDAEGAAQIAIAADDSEPISVTCADIQLPEPTAMPELFDTLSIDLDDITDLDPENLPTVTVQFDIQTIETSPVIEATLNEQVFTLDSGGQTTVLFDLNREDVRAALRLGRNDLLISARAPESAPDVLLASVPRVFDIPATPIMLELSAEGDPMLDSLAGDVAFVASVPQSTAAILTNNGIDRVAFELLPSPPEAVPLDPVPLEEGQARLAVSAIDDLPDAAQIMQVRAILVDGEGNPVASDISVPATLDVGVNVAQLDPIFLIVTFGLSLLLLILDIFLLRQIRVTRIKRLIEGEDAHPLPASHMYVTVKADYRADTHNLLKRTMTIGRGSSNDITLPDDAGVSRQHGVLIWRRRRWYFTHRNNKSVSTIDKRKVQGYRLVEIKPAMQIRVRNFILTFHRENEDPDDLTKTQF